MNIKRLLQILTSAAMVAVICMTFTGCSDDEPKEGDLTSIIVGVWSQDGDDDILVFESNGTGASYDNYSDYQNKLVDAAISWSYKDEWFKMGFGEVNQTNIEQNEIMQLVSASEDKIVWKWYEEWDATDEDEFGSYHLWTMKRLKK